MFKSFFKIDEIKPIHENLSFWLSILFFPAIAALFSIPIVLTEVDLSSPCLSSKCYATFYKLFSFPLWLATGGLILGVIYTRIYISKQSSAKLSLEYREETYKRYFDHRDRVSSYGEEFIKLNETYFKMAFDNYYFDFDRLYKKIFPKNSPSKYFSFEAELNGGDLILDIQSTQSKHIENVINSYNNGLTLNIDGKETQKTPSQFNSTLHAYIHSFAYNCFISTSKTSKPEEFTPVHMHATLTILLRFIIYILERCEVDIDEKRVNKAHEDLTKVINSNTHSLKEILLAVRK